MTVTHGYPRLGSHVPETSWPTGNIRSVVGVRMRTVDTALQVDPVDDVQPADALLDEMQQLAERYARMVSAL